MLEQVVVDGFFARTSLDDLPRENRMAGLQEFGLPYASAAPFLDASALTDACPSRPVRHAARNSSGPISRASGAGKPSPL